MPHFYIFNLNGEFTIATKNNSAVKINNEINHPSVRVIGPDGSGLGIMTSREAKRLAAEQELDLIEVNPQGEPPVVKIYDYSKFLYQEKQRKKEHKAKQATVVLKEIQMSPHIAEHDLETKIKKIQECLDKGNKVRVKILFKGRQITHTNLGFSIARSILDSIQCSIDKNPGMEGRDLIMILSPKK